MGGPKDAKCSGGNIRSGNPGGHALLTIGSGLLAPGHVIDTVSLSFRYAAGYAPAKGATKAASVGAHAGLVHIIIILFMVLAGCNFGLYHALLRRKFREVFTDPELRVYLFILAAATAAIAFWIHGTTITTTRGEPIEATTGIAIREAAFNVVAIQTTTGFGTADFNLWSAPAKLLLVVLMFVRVDCDTVRGLGHHRRGNRWWWRV